MAIKETERKYKPYKRLTQEQIEYIYKLFEEKMEQRKIAVLKQIWRNQRKLMLLKILIFI